MSKRLVIHLLVCVINADIVIWLINWTRHAFNPSFAEMQEALEKPWRPFARILLTAFIAVLLFGVQALVILRQSQNDPR